MSSSGVPLFQELPNSPSLHLGRGDHSATRRFLISWENLQAFCKELARGGVSGRPMTCPGLTESYVSDIRPKPYTEDHYPDSTVITDPSVAINTYTGPGSKFKCLVEVDYALDYFNVTWPSTIPKPTVQSHHALRLSLRTSGQFLTYPSRAGDWDGTPYAGGTSSGQSSSNANGQDISVVGGGDLTKISPDIGNRILLCIQDLKVEWYYVRDIDTLTLDGLVGWCNSTPFLGGAAGTVLFEGYDLDEDKLLDVDNPFCYKITLNFRKRCKKLGSGKWVTWNHDFKDRTIAGPGGWTLITMSDGRLRYELGSLSAIFALGT